MTTEPQTPIRLFCHVAGLFTTAACAPCPAIPVYLKGSELMLREWDVTAALDSCWYLCPAEVLTAIKTQTKAMEKSRTPPMWTLDTLHKCLSTLPPPCGLLNTTNTCGAVLLGCLRILKLEACPTASQVLDAAAAIVAPWVTTPVPTLLLQRWIKTAGRPVMAAPWISKDCHPDGSRRHLGVHFLTRPPQTPCLRVPMGLFRRPRPPAHGVTGPGPLVGVCLPRGLGFTRHGCVLNMELHVIFWASPHKGLVAVVDINVLVPAFLRSLVRQTGCDTGIGPLALCEALVRHADAVPSATPCPGCPRSLWALRALDALGVALADSVHALDLTPKQGLAFAATVALGRAPPPLVAPYLLHSLVDVLADMPPARQALFGWCVGSQRVFPLEGDAAVGVPVPQPRPQKTSQAERRSVSRSRDAPLRGRVWTAKQREDTWQGQCVLCNTGLDVLRAKCASSVTIGPGFDTFETALAATPDSLGVLDLRIAHNATTRSPLALTHMCGSVAAPPVFDPSILEPLLGLDTLPTATLFVHTVCKKTLLQRAAHFLAL